MVDKMKKEELLNQKIGETGIKEEISIKPESKILFIGDSITDVGRNRNDAKDLGHGFPMLIAADLLRKYPHYNLEILNRGISGDKVSDLKERWEKDCLELAPELVTILIGINDVGHMVDDSEIPKKEELEKFEADYRFLLKSLAQWTDARVVLMEPFVLPYPKDRLNWRKQLDPRIQIVRRIAKDYHAILIPLDGLLNAKGITTDYHIYTGDDGVHPTMTGHATIADLWLKQLNL